MTEFTSQFVNRAYFFTFQSEITQTKQSTHATLVVETELKFHCNLFVIYDSMTQWILFGVIYSYLRTCIRLSTLLLYCFKQPMDTELSSQIINIKKNYIKYFWYWFYLCIFASHLTCACFWIVFAIATDEIIFIVISDEIIARVTTIFYLINDGWNHTRSSISLSSHWFQALCME